MSEDDLKLPFPTHAIGPQSTLKQDDRGLVRDIIPEAANA